MAKSGLLNSKFGELGFVTVTLQNVVPQKAIKSLAIADFLTEHTNPKSSKLYEDITDEIVEANMVFEEQVLLLFFEAWLDEQQLE